MNTLRIAIILTTVITSPAWAGCALDQEQSSWNSTSGGFRWQSFTPGDAGLLCQVDVNTTNAQNGVVLEVYEGEGTTGALLHTEELDLAGDVTAIPITGVVPVDAGETYTLHFADIPTWRLQTGDPYAGGVGNINPDVDFWFRTYVAAESTPTRPRSWGGVKSVYR